MPLGGAIAMVALPANESFAAAAVADSTVVADSAGSATATHAPASSRYSGAAVPAFPGWL